MGLITLWYMCSIIASNSAKVFLGVLASPMLLSLAEFFSVAFYSGIYLYGVKRVKFRLFQRRFFLAVLPFSAGHLLGILATHMALQELSVSFVHTLKGLSPIVTFLISVVILRERVQLKQASMIVPISLGVLICSFEEFDFDAFGVVVTLISVVVFSALNIATKHVLLTKELSELEMIHSVTLLSFVWMLPLYFFGSEPSPSSSPMDHDVMVVIGCLLMNGLAHFVQSCAAIVVLHMVSPLSYSIANAFKRLFIIVVAVFFFARPLSAYNYFGVFLSFLGILFYNAFGVKQDEPGANNPIVVL